MTQAGCAFCAIVAGKSPAHRVLEDDACVAFLDARPLFPGHVLVVPRTHRETMADLDSSEIAALFQNARQICLALERGLGAEGTFVAMNNRISQSVAHAHVHVVPRHKGDGLRGFFWPRQKYANAGQAEDIAAKVRAALSHSG